MSFFPFSRKSSGSRRVFVISLDGVPHSFLARHIPEGAFPNLARLFADGDLRRMSTVQPPVPNVVWASFATGMNPGRHGVYGLVERRPDDYDIFLPGSHDLDAPPLWDVLGGAGKSTIVVNVPGTWPPRPVRGVLIAPARAATLEEIVCPHHLGSFLRGIGYRLDVDTRSGQEGNKNDLLTDLDQVLHKRFAAAFSLLHREPWDYFQLHISETDRINHYFWEDYESDTPGYGRAFLSFYRTLDGLIGELLSIVPAGVEVIVLSGNGFQRLRREIYINRALEERGWLEFEPGEGRRLGMISRNARAYSLAPGRVYMHVKGREPKGGISGGDEYRGYRNGVAADLLRLTDPENGQTLVSAVLKGEEICRNPAWPAFPLPVSGRRPAPCDMLVVPAAGYEIKGHIDRETITGRSEMTGMHARDDAFVFVRGRSIRRREPGIEDICPTVLKLMGVHPDESPDGKSLV